MNPSRSAIVAIGAEVTNWSPTDAAIAAALNAPAITNPTPQGQVLAPFTAQSLLELLGAPSQIKIRPEIPTLIPLINAADRVSIGGWAVYLAGIGAMEPSEASAVASALSATIADPNYQSLISWAQATLGRPVDAADVAAARP